MGATSRPMVAGNVSEGDLARWYLARGCGHAHCPFGCEHPQPFLIEGVLLCGRCWFKERLRTPMIPCGPEVCE